MQKRLIAFSGYKTLAMGEPYSSSMFRNGGIPWGILDLKTFLFAMEIGMS